MNNYVHRSIDKFQKHIKKNIKGCVPLFIVLSLCSLGILIWGEVMEVKYKRLEASMAENVKAYEDAYFNHSHPHDPVSQTNLDLEVQQVHNQELSIE